MVANRNCILRLSRYKNALCRLRNLGFVKVFSENLADASGVTSAQVRKDFSIFGITGNKRGGYEIARLIDGLNDILGKNEIHKVIIAGAGKIGKALMEYKGFEQEGIEIVASFDIDPSKYRSEEVIPVLPFERMREFIDKEKIEIGILCVPDIAAQRVMEMMVSAGIKGILNFAPIRLRESEGITINNVNLGLELENLIYFVIAGRKEKMR